ncbi:MAG: hypothetical protein K8L99_03800 [Anaerolineae bacterium]|nr:hypothetical protein [Anaerolineae bacterium]
MRYSTAEKESALRRLDALGGVYTRASAETGIPPKTLSRWARERDANQAALHALQNGMDTLRECRQDPSDEDEDPILVLHEQLVENALVLAESLKSVIEAAPLSQRASALSQLIDKIIKLSDMLPKREVIIRFEYEDPQVDPFYQPASGPGEDYEE